MNPQESMAAQANGIPVVTKIGPMLHEGVITAQGTGECTIETTEGYKISHIAVAKVSIKQN